MAFQMRDTRLKTGRTGIVYRPAWGFKGSTKAKILSELEDCPRPVLHIPCGASNIGDVKADLFHPGAQVKCDVEALPFRNVGTILSDPPWGLPVDVRQRWISQFFKALRPGGVLLLYAPWFPHYRRLELERAWVRQFTGGFPHNAVLLTRWRRTE